MNETARFKLPFLVPGQAQKEFFHNEALQLLDMVVQPVVDALPANAPPSVVDEGRAYLVSGSPEGPWQGQPHTLASLTGGGWRFLPAFEGMECKYRPTRETLTFVDGAWLLGVANVQAVRVSGKQVVGPQQAAIAAPVGGGVLDQEARTAIRQVLDALRQHGLIASA